MQAIHQTLHSNYGFCLWTLLAFVVFAVMLIVLGAHMSKQHKRTEEFGREFEEKHGYALPEEGR